MEAGRRKGKARVLKQRESWHSTTTAGAGQSPGSRGGA
uniref:Uncharacterized protein n=1 Tax=Oryctolagus cuniculus TaxID=9986 RepID=G1TQW4_RABIT